MDEVTPFAVSWFFWEQPRHLPGNRQRESEAAVHRRAAHIVCWENPSGWACG